MKDYICHYGVRTENSDGYLKFRKNIENQEIFFTLNEVFKRKKSLPISIFVLMISRKYELRIYYTFLQEF